MDAAKLKPVGPWVLVKVDPPARTTESGLYLPEGNLAERTGMSTGTVVAVGSGKPTAYGREPMPVKEGEKVLFRGYLQEAKRPGGIEDKEHSLIHIDDLVGVIEE